MMKNGKIHILVAVCGVILVLAMLIVPIGAACADGIVLNDYYHNIVWNGDFSDWSYDPYMQIGFPASDATGVGPIAPIEWNVNQTQYGWSFGASNANPSRKPFLAQYNGGDTYGVLQGLKLPYTYNYGYYMQQYVDVAPGEVHTALVFGYKIVPGNGGNSDLVTFALYSGNITIPSNNGLSNTINSDGGNFIMRIRRQSATQYRLEVGTYWRTSGNTDAFFLLVGVVLSSGQVSLPVFVPNSYSNYGVDQAISLYVQSHSVPNQLDLDAAYNRGYNAGLAMAETGDFRSLITAVIDVPFNSISKMFDFDLLGYNIAGVLGTLIVVAIGIIIVKRII